MTTVLSIGPTYTLTTALAYALPAKSVRIAVKTANTVSTSVDGTNWQSITLDSNSEFVTAAKYIRANTDAIVSVKET